MEPKPDPDAPAHPHKKTQLADAAQLEDTPYYADFEKTGKKMKPKNNPYGKVKSRLQRYKHLRKPVRNSVAVYNARSMRTALLKNVKALCASVEVIDLTGSDSEAEEEDSPTPPTGHASLVKTTDQFTDYWPDGSRKISESENPEGLRFPDYGDLESCDCVRDCFRDVCSNAEAGVYCTPVNCACNGRCSNSSYELRGLELVVTKYGYGIRSTEYIPVGCVIGEYTGILTTHDYDKDVEVVSEYAMKLQTKSSSKKVFIDAKECGGQTRFINHSCAPNCIFAEARFRRTAKVLVVVIKPIRAGEAVTVSYGDELWFTCACESDNCKSRVT